MTGLNATDFLKTLKITRAWTNAEMAAALGVTEKSIQRYLKGHNCTPEVIQLLIDSYGFKPVRTEGVQVTLERIEKNQQMMMVFLQKIATAVGARDHQGDQRPAAHNMGKGERNAKSKGNSE